LAWGAFHALLFLPLILMGRNRKYTDVVAIGRLFPKGKELLQMTLTFVLVALGWILFRSPHITDAWGFFTGIFASGFLSQIDIPKKTIVFVVLMFLVEWIQRNREHGLALEGVSNGVARYACYLALLVFIFVFGVFNETFIYFQF
jgi:D-alanyl-lipoteichoic acid acyltransferase DltB (MBOAT superfamily)